MVTTPQAPAQPTVTQQAIKLCTHFSGYLATWVIDLGLRAGLLDELARRSEAISAGGLAEHLGLDPHYTRVWCRSAYAAGVLDLSDEQAYALAPHMATLLVDADGPNYMGGMAHTFVALRESFLDLRAFVKTGQREWWSGFDSEWIEAVGDSGQAYYRRILERVLPHLPAVHAKLEAGARVLDLACGVCKGPIKVARAYPSTTFTVVDGDAYTLEQARTNLARHGLAERFEVLHAPLEELALRDAYDVAIINISLHEARDIERVVANVRRALRERGTFLVSEFPFPETLEACRALPGQLMSGIQFFEAHIGCRLLPISRFVELLDKAGFRDLGAIEASPLHVVVHGTK
ncbi:MAG: methyltransferase domain-containing protein [Chloroflexi bacterium]|nr:methyltransferase domain-containing protein [Chloroflexota bacterium]